MRHSVRARHRARVRLPLMLACVIGSLAAPASALATGGSGVHVDPNSPVAKEYALPLATARGAPPESGQGGKLFGSGITHTGTAGAPPATVTAPPPALSAPPATATNPAAPGTQTGTTTTKPRPPIHRAPPHITTVALPTLTTSRALAASATPAAYRVLRPGTGGGLLWMIAVGVIVVALGSAGGVALTRRR